MPDAFRAGRPWLTFIGIVLVVGILYWAQAVIVPLAFSVLMAFLLTPVVSVLQRWIGRIPAVLSVVVLAFVALGLVGWMITQQVTGLVAELPMYRENIIEKIRDVRGAGARAGDSVEKLQETVEGIQQEIETPEETAQRRASSQRAEARERPLIVRPESTSRLWGFPAVIGPMLGPLATAGLIIALVIFLLLEREELRNRLIRLFGHGELVATTRAFDEAGWRVSRYLLAQSAVNGLYGVGAGLGLWLVGVPYPLLWASLGFALRYIPYVGPVVAAVSPVLVSFAVLEGWTRPIVVVSLYVVLELFTNLVLETAFYAGVAGISQVALLTAVAFWSWLWGPLGLLMATPLTVCMAVMGKYVPGLEFMTMLVSDEPVLAPHVSYYQRLIAGDPAEAADLLDRHVAEESAESAYDAMMLPALTYAERDRIEGRLTADEERAVIEATRELMADFSVNAAARVPEEEDESALASPLGSPVPVLGVAADGEGDVIALRMLEDLLAGRPIALEVQESGVLSAEVVKTVQKGAYRAVCIADLPPSPPTRSRYLVKRLRAIAPDLPILVGRWAPPELADDDGQLLAAAGATHVSATLLDTRDQLASLLPVLIGKKPQKPDAG